MLPWARGQGTRIADTRETGGWPASQPRARSVLGQRDLGREATSSREAGARGSANVAVPTCTAEAPASSSSGASQPLPRRRRRRWADRAARRGRRGRAHGDRVDRWPGQSTAAGAERGTLRRRVVGQPEQGVDARHGIGAGGSHGVGDVHDAVGVRAQLRPARSAARPAVAAITAADSSGSWAKIDSRPSRFGQDRFTSTATTSAGASASSSAALA